MRAHAGAGRRAWGSELDNLAKFACVLRYLVLVSPPSLWIRKLELECNCEFALGGVNDFLFKSGWGWICTRRAARALRSRGGLELRLRPSH